MDIGTEPLELQERDERLAEYQRLEQETSRHDLATVLSTIEGRRFVDMLRRDTGIRAMSYVPGASERDVFFSEGRRSIGIDLEARLLHPDLLAKFEQLEKEHRDRIRARNDHLAGR